VRQAHCGENPARPACQATAVRGGGPGLPPGRATEADGERWSHRTPGSLSARGEEKAVVDRRSALTGVTWAWAAAVGPPVGAVVAAPEPHRGGFKSAAAAHSGDFRDGFRESGVSRVWPYGAARWEQLAVTSDQGPQKVVGEGPTCLHDAISAGAATGTTSSDFQQPVTEPENRNASGAARDTPATDVAIAHPSGSSFRIMSRSVNGLYGFAR
jgi:hypothetical protein